MQVGMYLASISLDARDRRADLWCLQYKTGSQDLEKIEKGARQGIGRSY